MKDDMPAGSISEGRRLLDRIYKRFARDPDGVSETMANLLQGLYEIRRDMPADQWSIFCREIVPQHEVTRLIRQDPFTLHSVRKPRGYAGDAMLLDYIYGYRPPKATPIGESIFSFTTNTPTSRAVRTRATMIAGIIDRIARERPNPRILSIACGHLREAEMSTAVREGRIREYVAFDQDKDSIEHVRTTFGASQVKTVLGSVGHLLMGKYRELTGFDFVYAAGLYDYLSQKLATRLTTWMFNATAPAGVTLLTNYLPDIVGAGYMEAFMEWNLIFRSPEELVDTARRIPGDQIAGKRVYIEKDQRIVFVELSKAVQPQPRVTTPFDPVDTRQADKRRTGKTELPVSY